VGGKDMAIYMKYKLIMNGLDCAHCAAEVEQAIANTDGFAEVSLVFATKSLYFEHVEDEDIVSKVQKITDSVEDGVTVSFEKHNHSHHHCHGECCEGEHHHEDKKSVNIANILLFAAIGFAAAALILDMLHINEISVAILSACAIIMSGYKVCLSGVKSVIKLRLDETTLMTIAVITAFCLGQFVEGAMVTILFGIGEMLEDKAVANSRKSIENLANIQADTADITVNGKITTVSAESVVPGTEIVIKPFDRIPLDCVITEGSTSVDTSAVTGESIPVNCKPGDELLSGMLNGENLIKAKTTKAYSDSAASRIIKLVEEASTTKSDNEKLITRFAKIYTPVVIAISLMIAFIPPIFAGNILQWIYRGLVCLVASCPCAIVISIPLAYYSGIGAASKSGILIKGGKYLDALAKADSAAFDKTGTLTEGKPELTDIILYSKYSRDEVLAIAASVERHSSHPIAKAIKDSYSGQFLEMTDYNEYAGKGVNAVYKDKSVSCVSNNDKIALIIDGETAAEFIISDKIREETPSVINSLKKLGVKKLVMLTGDNKKNSDIVSDKLGIENLFGLLPEEKLNSLNELKNESKAVCFVGDGINDAPVIAAADCGFAMGLGSDAAIASADAVLTSGNLSALPKAFILAKKVVKTCKINITFALLIKLIVVVLAFFGLAAIWMSVIADTGVCLVCVMYAMRILKHH
jgi:Cd2+/Zn2+-exporting ATPase